MDRNCFIEELKKINIEINEEKLAKFDRYYQLLIEWNEKINLTRIIKKDDVYLKHFYDSLTLYRAVDLNKELNLCDIGTGAGFPGIVLKIVFPKLKITLVDSLLKRVKFLNIVINELELDNISAIHIRAEDFIKDNKGKYDIVTCRAVSRLSNLIGYCVPLLKKEGLFLPMKANCDDEIEEIRKNNKIKVNKIVRFILPIENSNRTIIEIKKS